MHKVLIIDDQKKYVQSQIELAGNMGIDLEHIDNWEDAQKYLEQNPDYFKAIIIDGKGKLTKDGKEENSNHLSVALKWLDVQRGKGNYLYHVVNTGFVEEIKKWFDSVPIYGKLGQEKKMFEEILIRIESNDSQKIKTKYADVFEVFDKKYLDSKTEAQLIKAIQDCDKQKLEEIKGNLTNIRGVQEAIYNALRSDKMGIVPKNMTKHGDIKKLLDGNPDPQKDYTPTSAVYQNSSISNLSNTLYWVSGQYIHNIDKQTYFISHYTVKSLLYDLMELLLWFKETANKHYKK
jgi:hypothetical protein